MKETKYILAFVFVGTIFYFLLMNGSRSGSGQRSGDTPKSLNSTNLGFVKPEQRLIRLFSQVSSGAKLRLQGETQEIIYNKNTIPKPFNDKVVSLVQTMIDTIQRVTRQDYFMKRIENLYIQSDRSNNHRYIVDFFVYDVQNYYTLRLLSDIVAINGEIYLNYLNVQSGSNPSLLNKYDLKFDAMGILLKDNMFHENIRSLFDNYYVNHFEVIGISDMDEPGSRDLTKVYSLGSMLQLYFPSDESPETLKVYDEKGLIGQLENYLPPDQTNTLSPQFCDKAELRWDSLGVPYQSNTDKPQSCIMQNSSDQAVMNQPYFGPGIMYKRSSDDAYKWLKDPARGNIIRSTGYRS
tara:strand:- start:6430 stop:7482 length:1053 start_codon:yes stop_codon:yes gene_type:complete